MGGKRGTGRDSFIDGVLNAVDTFYGEVVQGLKVWAPTAPRLREAPPEVPTSGAGAVLASTALSSQDEELKPQTAPGPLGPVAPPAVN